ncbi:hypothetical protein [Corynebacterium liangguodongii]|uniref:hypothetical protein n=1 Tax=Corynebacterium liangguodongii TaxID=2079535 RepID=UPI0011B24E64|nr:hypothetical protein [Corynebacterium liangguodongii]
MITIAVISFPAVLLILSALKTRRTPNPGWGRLADVTITVAVLVLVGLNSNVAWNSFGLVWIWLALAVAAAAVAGYTVTRILSSAPSPAAAETAPRQE